VIAGGETESVHLVLIAQARIERTAERRAHAGLHRLHGDWAQPRKLPADRAGSRLHLVVADDELDQAQAEGLLRVNGIAREWEPHRLTVSDAPMAAGDGLHAPLGELDPRTLVFDVVVKSEPTPFMRHARSSAARRWAATP
jgi:shikimate 5-dehydrogenase